MIVAGCCRRLLLFLATGVEKEKLEKTSSLPPSCKRENLVGREGNFGFC